MRGHLFGGGALVLLIALACVLIIAASFGKREQK